MLTQSDSVALDHAQACATQEQQWLARRKVSMLFSRWNDYHGMDASAAHANKMQAT
jgi:hypothetical protein